MLSSIRAEWCKLSRSAKRGFYERVPVELELTQGERLHVNRFQVFARPCTPDESQNGKLEFWRGKQALFTDHHDNLVLPRPDWSFADAAEPLAAAAQACRDDPFVQHLNCELERDVLRIADQFMQDSWSVSLELCPDALLTSRVLRLHVHLALVFPRRLRVWKAEEFSLAGAVPVHCSATSPLQSVRARNFGPLHDYLNMQKRGGVWCATNLAAFEMFQ